VNKPAAAAAAASRLFRGTQRIVFTAVPFSTTTTTIAEGRPHGDSSSSSSLDSLKLQLLQKSLEYVPVHGWTSDAIAAAVATIPAGTSMAAAGLITVPDLIAYTMEQWNERLRRDVTLQATVNPMSSSSDSTTAETMIAWALQRRLSYEGDLIKANRWHEGMAMGAHPDSLLKTQQQVAEVIDIVLAAATTHCHNNSEKNPRTAPSSFSVVERVSLGAVYVATELHMLADTSIDFQDTWSFLRHRVHDWERLRRRTTTVTAAVGLPTHVVWQYHTPTDLFLTASAVGSALASGAMSLLGTASSAASSSAKPIHHAYTGQGEDYSVNVKDGSHPSHYESSSTSTATKNGR
jgi:ubiquinone biosynthesis protein COQ9